jgi:hypothetical protein
MNNKSSSEKFDAAFDRLWKTGVGGALIMVPFILGDALGLPSGVLLGYLLLAAGVLGVVVLRRLVRDRKGRTEHGPAS